MATGITSLTQITNAIERYIDEVQFVADDSGIFERLITTRRFPRGKGLLWTEPYFGTLTATDLVDGTIFDDPTLITDSAFTLTPTEKGIQVLWSDRLVRAMKENFPRIASEMSGNALAYRMDQDLITVAQSGGLTLGGATVPATTGIISAALRSIQAGVALGSQVARTGARTTGEKAKGPYHVVLHPYHGHDLFGQWTSTAIPASALGAGVAVTGNYTRSSDVNQYNTAWLEGMEGVKIPGLNADLWWDSNIPLASGTYASGAAKGAVFTEDAMVNLLYQSIERYQERTFDGRNTRVTLWRDNAVGLRVDVHLVVLHLDTSAPAT
jgi:hypothetical protein